MNDIEICDDDNQSYLEGHLINVNEDSSSDSCRDCIELRNLFEDDDDAVKCDACMSTILSRDLKREESKLILII